MQERPPSRDPNHEDLSRRRPLQRPDRTHRRPLRAVLAAAAEGAAGRAQHRRHPARRCGLRAAGLLRLGHPHPAHGPPGRRRPALPRLPHHGHLLAHPGLPAHRAQPPLQRRGHHPGDGHRLPGLQRDDSEGERLPVGDAAGPGLRDLRHRQVAPDAGRRVRLGRVEGALAAVARLRALLRLPRGQDQPVVAHAGARQPLHRPTRELEGRLPPERRPGRPGDALRERLAHRGARQALLHVLLLGRRPRAAPVRAGMDRALPRAVRRRLGRLARAGLRAPVAQRHHPAKHDAERAPALGARLGQPVGRRAAAVRAPDGGLRRLHGADRSPHRPLHRRPGAPGRAR